MINTIEYDDSQNHPSHNLSNQGASGNITAENSQICLFLSQQVQTAGLASGIKFFQLFFLERARESQEFAYQEINNLLIANQEQDFFKIITKSIYILLDSCVAQDSYPLIHHFLKVIDAANLKKHIKGNRDENLVDKYQRWLQTFLNSQNYITARLALTRYSRKNVEHWSYYYSPFLLLAESIKEGLSAEQIRVCQSLSTELMRQFRFKLEMYLGRSQAGLAKNKIWRNPTRLADSNLNILKSLSDRFTKEYRPKAQLTLNQLDGLTYGEAKQKIVAYLCHDTPVHKFPGWLAPKIKEALGQCYPEMEDEYYQANHIIDTSQKFIHYLINAQNNHNPSHLFTVLVISKDYLTLVILIVKVFFLCPEIYSYIIFCCAELISFNQHRPESECKWLISFLEILQFFLIMSIDQKRFDQFYPPR